MNTQTSEQPEAEGVDIELTMAFKILTHLFSIILLPIVLTIFITQGVVNGQFWGMVGTSILFILLTSIPVLVLYAIAGGFEWDHEKLPKGRRFWFFFLSGMLPGILLYGLWLILRLILAKIFGIQMSAAKGRLLHT